MIEGAVGSVVATEATDYNKMPFLASMTSKGLFSWNSIASDATQDITFYADLLTGVKKINIKLSLMTFQEPPLISIHLFSIG
ncbi:hypothetical protein KUH03_03370 [Sphingobacterium sp. E70]|uniref:hypothetical protein n=1 Tax=Sphingobacterium sp. E70 TaxID=2853439 RepID=UPI00211C5619|nr:hypothetical protein [Sphingobacterium sp. E70]ULT26025.1 hypothetical protein KUH03_03370 [Sphingobacterium sp. E70]